MKKRSLNSRIDAVLRKGLAGINPKICAYIRSNILRVVNDFLEKEIASKDLVDKK